MALSSSTQPCRLCGQALGTAGMVLFPPFVANESDPMYVFHDATVHEKCLADHPLGRRALEAREAFHNATEACLACGMSLRDGSGDVFTTGLLTSDPSSPVYDYNFIRIHRDHFAAWHKAAEFRRLVGAFVASSAWKGAALNFDPSPEWRLDAARKLRVVLSHRPSDG